jgi:hypothetical protein
MPTEIKEFVSIIHSTRYQSEFDPFTTITNEVAHTLYFYFSNRCLVCSTSAYLSLLLHTDITMFISNPPIPLPSHLPLTLIYFLFYISPPIHYLLN